MKAFLVLVAAFALGLFFGREVWPNPDREGGPVHGRGKLVPSSTTGTALDAGVSNAPAKKHPRILDLYLIKSQPPAQTP